MLEIKIDGLDLLARLGVSASKIRAGIYSRLEQEMKDFGNRLVRQGKLNVTDMPGGLRVRTGHLRASINSVFSKQDSTFVLDFGANVPYARIHELGGDIKRTSRSGKGYVIHIKKRAYLSPALQQEYPRFADRVKALLRAAAMEGFNVQQA